jgi:hypothetical protein
MLEMIVLLIWLLPWLLGGWLLASSLFRLRTAESGVVGLGIGLVLQIWLVNLLSHVIAIPQSFWLSSGLVMVTGVAAALHIRPELRLRLDLPQWILLGGLTFLFNAIGRGLGVFDDYQNLPTVSLMAAGDVPPHFALDPSLRFGYHYLLLLFAAEFMRLGNMFPWSALDLARSLTLALPLVLAGLWAYRLTRSRLAAFLTGGLVAFAGGARWLLLLLPSTWVAAISREITLIGSAASSAPSLAEAMIGSWRIDGAGPIPFPFAFYSGMNQPYIMAYTGIAGSGILILLLMLLTVHRGRHWGAVVISGAMLASLAIANEIAFLLLGMGTVVAAFVWLVAGGKRRGTAGMRSWLAIIASATVLAILQGGMLTEMLFVLLRQGAATRSYFDPTPAAVWPPALVSAHFGSLSVVSFPQLIVALLEIGPVVLVSPLVFAWGWRSLRLGRWFEASLIASSVGALVAAFIVFRGPLFSAAPRLMGGWFFACALYFIPLLWIWLKGHPEAWRIGALAVGFASCLGGLVLFGVQLPAIQTPTYATFITSMDAKMADQYWNALDPGDLVFDPLVFRAPTVFGRFTRSSPTWYTRSREWEALNQNPNPFDIRAAGFTYLYLDGGYWEELEDQLQRALQDPCVVQVAQVDGIRSKSDYRKDFRRLLDIRACK